MKVSISHSTRIQRVAQIVILSVSIVFLIFQLAQNADRVRNEIHDLDWTGFALATLLLVLAWGLLALPTYLALKSCEIPLSYTEALGVFNISQVVKYLPGGLWALPGRMVLYQRRYHLQVRVALFLVLWETFALLASAVLVGGLALPAMVSPFLRLAWLGLSAVSLLVIQFGGQLLRIKSWAAKRFPPLTRFFQDDPAASTLTLGTLWKMILATILFWLITGIGFHLLMMAVTQSSTGIHWLQSIGIYSLAWAIGFLVIFVPAGIGIREGALVFLLKPLVTDSEAILIAILARMWWTMAEAFWIVAALWVMQTFES
jgi:uncharacterized membrane protein YbhN (UPF0104 family)